MKKGLTLTELLVATILMGIVMAGAAAFSVFVKQAQDSTSTGTILAVQTATAMRYIKEDAIRAIGDHSDRGVKSSALQESICFRHDVNNPTLYTDDEWACYWYDAASDALWKCAIRNFATGAPPLNFGDCNQAGTVKLVSLNPALTNYFAIVNDADGRLGYVNITLNTIYDPAQVADPIKNPTYQLATRVSPPAHGH